MTDILSVRIRDRLTVSWLTPSQKQVWELVQRFDGPPHRVVNIYGTEGTGKTFLGWLMESLSYATYRVWPNIQKPFLPRLILDDMVSDHLLTRSLRPLVDQYSMRQLILLSRTRVDEQAMPAFELRVTSDDIDVFRANLYRDLQISLPEADQLNYKAVLEKLI